VVVQIFEINKTIGFTITNLQVMKVTFVKRFIEPERPVSLSIIFGIFLPSLNGPHHWLVKIHRIGPNYENKINFVQD